MPDWENVYADKSPENAIAAEVLKQNLHLLENTGDALDFACGMAANGILLEEMGYNVMAWDLSGAAIDKVRKYSQDNKLKLQAKKIDLEKHFPHKPDCYDVIVVSYFLHRAGLRDLYTMLKKNGLLFYQTFSGKQIDGIGPSREEFRLRRGELLEVFGDMELLYYREDHQGSTGGKPGQVSFIARK